MATYSIAASCRARDVEAAGSKAYTLVQRTSLWHYLAALAVAIGWVACSCSIIMLNRKLLVSLKFHYPFALSAWGQLLSGVFAWACRTGTPDMQVSTKFYLRRVVPVGIAQGVGIFLSNNLYLLLTVSFIEMARSTLPLFTLGALYLAGLEHPNGQLIRSVLLIVVGCLISAYGEVKLSVLGVLCLLANFCTEGARLVMTQYLLQACDCNPWYTLSLLSWPSAITLATMSITLELGRMREEGAGAIIAAHWPVFLASGAVGVAAGYLSSLIIKLSGATTLKVLAAVRGPLLVLSGVVLLSETVTHLQLIGYCLALLGFVGYNTAKPRSGLSHQN
uniref:Sugar phosphate transporter domain-containing protein n=1 Tax=Dunaliella tertiolecta TaxID=3047 RepID=A0A7S3R7M3_DUNTE|mmetsp:Transcript_14276/g.38715  ORF Transcript_14276/g.38715 Transcript_14276/m.38715 type:complete len:334 (+) Transcript_14276:139-1140(+)